MTRASCALALAALAGCSHVTDGFEDKPFSGDPFPIAVDTSSGAVVLGARVAGQDEVTAVLDVLSPLTTVEPSPALPLVSNSEVELFGETAPGVFDVPRADFTRRLAPQVVTLHPCGPGPVCTIGGSTCAVGTPTAPLGFAALLGDDMFGNDALRLALARDQIYVFPDIAGDDIHRTRSCDAVFDAPFRGGGTLVIGGSELPFAGWRVAIQACLAPDPRELDASGNLVPQSQRGADVLFVASTGIGVSLLGEAAYERYRLVVPSAPSIDQLPVDLACLPSGPVEGHRTTIAMLALVGNTPNVAGTASNGATPRAPCRQVYAHHKLATADCYAPNSIHFDSATGQVLFVGDPDCPCVPGDPNNLDHGLFCSVPAVVELAPPGGLDVLVVSDDNATLQALRTELRPDQAEVDGILGANALHSLELDLDYQHGRALARCLDPTICGARPELLVPSDRGYVVGDCIAADPGPIR